jgi:hypothetical protein
LDGIFYKSQHWLLEEGSLVALYPIKNYCIPPTLEIFWPNASSSINSSYRKKVENKGANPCFFLKYLKRCSKNISFKSPRGAQG